MPSSTKMPSFLLFGFLLLLGLVVSTTHAATLEKSWTLYHSVNGGQDFSKRASVVLSVDPETDGSVDLSITNDNSTLNQETFNAVRAEGSMYQLKLVEGDGESDDFILSSVPGCQLLRANFREELVISLGPKASAISLTYIPLVSPLAPKSCSDPFWDERAKNNNLQEQGWDSRISWETATPGMALRAVMPSYRPPVGLKWLPRLGTNGKLYQAKGPPGSGDEKGKGGAGGGGDPEVDATPMGFMRRYWYIIVPLMLMNLMGGEPPAPEGQQQAGAAAAGGAAAAAGAAAAGAAPKQRRGKRG